MKSNSRALKTKFITIFLLSLTLLLASCASNEKKIIQRQSYLSNLGFSTGELTDKNIQITGRTIKFEYQDSGPPIFVGNVLVNTEGTEITKTERTGKLHLEFIKLLASALNGESFTSASIKAVDQFTNGESDDILIEVVFDDVFDSYEAGTRINATINATSSEGYRFEKRYSGFNIMGALSCLYCSSSDVIFRKIYREFIEDLAISIREDN